MSASAHAVVDSSRHGGHLEHKAIQDTDGFIYQSVEEISPDFGDTPDEEDLSAVVSALLDKSRQLASSNISGGGGAGAGNSDSQTSPPGGPRKPRTEELPSVADDFIRNFLIRNGMDRALDCFNNEWYDLKTKGKLPGEESLAVPDVYAQNQRLEDTAALLRTELSQATEIAAKAQATWDRFRRERDFHRMHHKRVVHEKNKLVVDIKRLQTHYSKFEPMIDELKVKYELAMKEKMLLRLERDRLAARIDALETQLKQGGGGGMGRGGADANEGGLAGVTTRTTTGGAAAAPATTTSGISIPGPPIHRSGIQAATASSRARVEERFASGPLPNIQAKALAAAAAETAALAKATRIPDSKFPVEDPPNPYLGLAFDPARASSYKLTGTVKAHGTSISSIAFHPSRHIFATTADDMLWRVWSVTSAQDAELLMNGEGHRAWLASCDFHPAGDRLATCSGDGIVKIWNLATASCSATFSEHLQTCWGVAFHHSGDFLASCSMDHSTKLWDVHTGRVRQSMRGHEDHVNAVVFQPFSANLATASGDKSVSMWDSRSGQCVQTFFGHKNAVNSLCFSTRGDTIASCDADGAVKLWDVKMVREKASASLGMQPVNSVAFDRSAQVLACACEDGVVRVFNCHADGLTSAISLRGHEDSAQSVAFDPTSQYLLSAGSDGTVRIWSEGVVKGAGLPTTSTDGGAMSSPNNRGGAGGAYGGPDGDD
jgi:WD40 repeat protein